MDAEMIEKVARAMHVVEANSFRWEDEDDVAQAAWRALARAAIAALSATPQAEASARGYVDDDRKRMVSEMQSMRDRLSGFFAKTCGDAFDGDIDTMLDAINLLKSIKIGPATPQAAQVPEDAVTRLAIYLAEKDGHDPHALLWGEPRVEAWVRYKADASDYLAAAQAQGVQS